MDNVDFTAAGTLLSPRPRVRNPFSAPNPLRRPPIPNPLCMNPIHPVPAANPSRPTPASARRLLELRVPQAGDLDVLRHLGTQVSVGRLHRLEHASNLVGNGVVPERRRPLFKAIFFSSSVKEGAVEAFKAARHAHN